MLKENPPGQPPEVRFCVWHFVDDRTCAVEQETELGPLVSWFQYWEEPGAIFRYPLSELTRRMFDGAERYAIRQEEDGSLWIKAHRFELSADLPLPERHDLIPSTRPGKDGQREQCPFKCRLEDYLDSMPVRSGPDAERYIPPVLDL